MPEIGGKYYTDEEVYQIWCWQNNRVDQEDIEEALDEYIEGELKTGPCWELMSRWAGQNRASIRETLFERLDEYRELQDDVLYDSGATLKQYAVRDIEDMYRYSMKGASTK